MPRISFPLTFLVFTEVLNAFNVYLKRLRNLERETRLSTSNIVFGIVYALIYKKQGLDHIGICLKFRVRCILKVKYFDQGHLNSISLLVSRALKCLFSACQIC